MNSFSFLLDHFQLAEAIGIEPPVVEDHVLGDEKVIFSIFGKRSFIVDLNSSSVSKIFLPLVAVVC